MFKNSCKAREKPSISVLKPRCLPPSNSTVFTAPQAVEAGPIESKKGIISNLNGWVTESPATPVQSANVMAS